ncbi:MAG: MBL fold metallo-hydrolase [Proteobacteria bacterium]|nr:MBL fold metallo-hydrolase [Pseudomonadota bacterium]
MKRLALTACLAVFAPMPAAADAPTPPKPQALAPGVWLIPGGILPKRQPDGNTVIFAAPKGLVVVDTGRHRWHRQAILEFARAQGRPIVAIVNSHWHLDHVSGNPDLKRAYPGAKVYASNAIDAALTGFLPKSAEQAKPYLGSGKLPPETEEDLRADFATIDNGRALKPDAPVTASGVRSLGGLKVQLNLAPNAATDGDVWLFEPKSGVAAVGDLVTLPAPFLDTACAKGWKAALDRVWATPFRIAVPGHGAPMTRAQFNSYRRAFSSLTDCAASSRPKAECAADWSAATADLRGADPQEAKRAQGMTEYYVADVLRAHGGNSAYCTAP